MCHADFAEYIGRIFRYGVPAALFIVLPGACAVQIWVWLTGQAETGESLGEMSIYVVATIAWMVIVRHFGWHARLKEQWSHMFS